jgi:hypothetical protein
MPISPSAPGGAATASPVRDQFQRFGSVEILVADWRGSTPADLRASMVAISNLVAKRPGKVLILFDVVGMRWDAKLPFEAVPWVRELSPKAARVAIAGASGLQLTVLTGMRSLTGMPLPVFDTREQAVAWLSRPRKQK